MMHASALGTGLKLFVTSFGNPMVGCSSSNPLKTKVYITQLFNVNDAARTPQISMNIRQHRVKCAVCLSSFYAYYNIQYCAVSN